MSHDKRQLLETLRSMRAEGKTLLEIAQALGISVGYAGWLCYEHEIPKARKKDLIRALQTHDDSGVIIGGAVSPKES